jgi:N-acetylmuramoyl-L-alanine amidase
MINFMPGKFYYGSYKSKFIAIGDDGHGLETPGKRTPKFKDGTVIKENQFNHAVKILFFEALKRCKIAAYDVSPERTDTSLSSRTSRANSLVKKPSDIKRMAYVSFHYDAYDGKWDTNKGGLTVYHHPYATMGNILAFSCHKYLKKGTKQIDRGIKTANFQVLRETKMAAILTENGFMDDRFEAGLMLNEDFQNEVAEEHCKGLCDFFKVEYIHPIANKSGLYKVQVGAFKSKQNASRLANRLTKDSYHCFIVKISGLYKVQAGAFKKKENAEKLIKQLKKDGYESFITYVK